MLRQERPDCVGDLAAAAVADRNVDEQSLVAGGRNPSYEIKSKIIILLTDGEQNAGKRTPQEAAELAKKWSNKIYTIGIGGQESLIRVPTLFGTQVIQRGPGVDKKTLTDLARETGGIFRMAEDGDALRAVYSEIDALEKSEIESIRYVDYTERFPPFALAALVLMALEILMRTTYFRRIP